MHIYIINWRVVHRWQYLCNTYCLLSTHCSNWFLSDDHMCLTWSWHVRCTPTPMTKITTPSENCSTWHTLSPIHILHSTVNVGSTNTFCRQKLDYCVLSLFGGIHGMIVNCYLASVSVNNTLPLSSVYQISPDIHCHLPEKSQSSTAGNNSAPTSAPLSLGHALYEIYVNTRLLGEQVKIILYWVYQTAHHQWHEAVSVLKCLARDRDIGWYELIKHCRLVKLGDLHQLCVLCNIVKIVKDIMSLHYLSHVPNHN